MGRRFAGWGPFFLSVYLRVCQLLLLRGPGALLFWLTKALPAVLNVLTWTPPLPTTPQYPRDAGASELLTSIGEGQQWATEDNDWPKLFIRLGQDPSNNGALIMLCRANRPGMCSNPPSDVARTGGGPSGNDGEEDFAPPPRRRPPPSPRFRVAPPSPRRP